MGIQIETLKAIIREFHGLQASDEELELIQPDLDAYMAEIEKLRELDLSKVVSVRVLRVKDGDIP